jgi:peptidylprolyl isomerase
MSPIQSSALHIALLVAFAFNASNATAQTAKASTTADSNKPKSMQDILDASKPTDWRPLNPKNTLYLELETGRVIIELAPKFAPAHSKNILALVKDGYFNGLSINRSQDNFVVQWGDPNSDDANKKKKFRTAKNAIPAEFSRSATGLTFTRLPDKDGWAPEVGFVDGMPAAKNPSTNDAWLAHCYGMVGAGRDVAADSSNGSELYVVTGQSPRQLDRNITVVGRVVQGMELLSVLPRGTGPLGFYEKAEQRAPIKAIRLMADVPASERTAIEVFKTETPAFTALVESRRNRRDDWYKVPAGHIDLCNVPFPTRPIKATKKK